MLRPVRDTRLSVRGRLLGAAATVAASMAMSGATLAQGLAGPGPVTAPVASAPAPVVAPVAPTVAPAAVAPAGGPEAGTIDVATLQSRIGKEKAARIEAHIARLHASLRITAAQEPLWQSFAAVMRQNVVQMDAVYAKRESGYGAMNAVQDLVSYGEVEAANARNVQMLLPPFRSLYDSFSPEQKKTADTTFLRYTDKAVKKPG